MDTVKLTIDGREVTVEPGTTISSRAQARHRDPDALLRRGSRAGRRRASSAPCRSRAPEPFAGLRHAGGRRDGGHHDSDDVREARKMALELLLSDHAGDCIAPCPPDARPAWTYRASSTRSRSAEPPGDGGDRRPADLPGVAGTRLPATVREMPAVRARRGTVDRRRCTVSPPIRTWRPRIASSSLAGRSRAARRSRSSVRARPA